MSKPKTKNETLDAGQKSAEQLHKEWVAALEESAVVHKELRDARQQLRGALEQFEKAQEHETLDPGSRAKCDRRLLRSIKLERRVREEARVARDAETKAWEATGLPAARSRPDEEELEAA